MGKMLKAYVAVGLLTGFAALAAPDNPYLPIAERNVFQLREPLSPPPPAAPPPVAEDNAELLLTGVVDFRLSRWALITSAERGKSPRSYTLAVGQRQDNLEVLDIDAETGTVRLLHGTAETVLSFKQNGPPSPSKLEELGRKYVAQAKPFTDEHARAHELREQREAERRALERVAVEAELTSREISTHMDTPRL